MSADEGQEIPRFVDDEISGLHPARHGFRSGPGREAALHPAPLLRAPAPSRRQVIRKVVPDTNTSDGVKR